MIEPLSWESRNEQLNNPFIQGATRPLKITLHSSSFNALSPEQMKALELIKELSSLEDIDLRDTATDAPHRLVISRDESRDYHDVTVGNGERWGGSTGISLRNSS